MYDWALELLLYVCIYVHLYVLVLVSSILAEKLAGNSISDITYFLSSGI